MPRPAAGSGTRTRTRTEEFNAVQPAYLRAAFENDERLRARLVEADVAVVRNTGGDDNNLCLLSALLQAAGVPPPEVEQRARNLRDQLSTVPDALGQALREGQGLYANREVFGPLVARIFPDRPAVPILVMTAGLQGAPLLFNPLWEHGGSAVDLATVPSATVVLLESPGHFEFVANASGRPWSAVLGGLEASAQGAQPPIATSRDVEIALGHGQEVDDTTVQPELTRVLRLAPQASISPGGLAEDAPPLEQARAFAAAQDTVDAAWYAMQRWRSLEVGRDVDGEVEEQRLAVPLYPRTGTDAPQSVPALQVSLRVRESLLTGMRVRGPGFEDIEVQYQEPDAKAKRGRDTRDLPAQQRQWLHEALEQCPPIAREAPIQFARRLAMASPGLNDEALAKGSKASTRSIRWDPTIRPPPLDPAELARLDSAVAQVPAADRRPGLRYARLLKLVDPWLTDAALASASKTTKSDLLRDRVIHPVTLPAQQLDRADRAARELPRKASESDTSYMARLAAHDDQLGPAALATLSGSLRTSKKRDKTLISLQAKRSIEELAASVRRVRPRREDEGAKDYARRLHQFDRRLDAKVIAEATGLSLHLVRKDPRVVTPPLSPRSLTRMEAAKAAVPRREGEANVKYARRLHQHDDGLGMAALARASDTPLNTLSANPTFNPPDLAADQQAMLDAALQAFPHGSTNHIKHVVSLKAHEPRLSVQALSKGSGISVSEVNRAISKAAGAAAQASPESTEPSAAPAAESTRPA